MRDESVKPHLPTTAQLGDSQRPAENGAAPPWESICTDAGPDLEAASTTRNSEKTRNSWGTVVVWRAGGRNISAGACCRLPCSTSSAASRNGSKDADGPEQRGAGVHWPAECDSRGKKTGTGGREESIGTVPSHKRIAQQRGPGRKNAAPQQHELGQ